MGHFLPIIYIVGWFGAVFGASYLINWLLVRSIVRRYYRFFVAPGVIVHELSHAVGCLITGSPIVEINFWKASGGHVKHLQPIDPTRRIISDPIIALAPIGGTFIVLALLTQLMWPDALKALYSTSLTTLISTINITSAQTWLYFYLVISLMATIAPSKTDIKYALASLIVISLLLIILLTIPGVSDILLNFGSRVRPLAFFTLGLLILGIIGAFILAIPVRRKHFSTKGQLE